MTSLNIVYSKASRVNAKGDTVQRFRINVNDKLILMKASDSFMFALKEGNTNTCVITKDASFKQSIEKLRALLVKEFPDGEVVDFLQLKDGCDDEWLCYAYVSEYAKYFDSKTRQAYGPNDLKGKHLEGDIILKISGVSVITSQTGEQRVYLDAAVYQCLVKPAESKPVEFETFTNTL